MASHAPVTIRPYEPHDLSAASTISALANRDDALSKHLTHSRDTRWTSYRASCAHRLKSTVHVPGTVCYVAECPTTGEMLGWAVWSRHGAADAAGARYNAGWWNWAVERPLLWAETKYFEWVPGADPTRDRDGWAKLGPVLGAGWPEGVFEEYWELDALNVHPDHFRKGVGRVLTLWGLERGREEGVPVLVHGSPAGVKLYEKVGFEALGRTMAFDEFVPEFRGPGLDGGGCWRMCWQPEGTDYVQRAKAKMQTAEKEQLTEKEMIEEKK